MPLHAPSQDLEARFAVFLNPIRDLTKNWEVDIAKYLEDYLVELAEIQITFDGGETTMNFAEAALLIQGSATVYSKKVEFLWQMVLQMLDLLSSKRSIETREEEPTKGGDCGRPKHHDTTLEFSRLDDVAIGKNIYLKDDDIEDELGSTLKFLPKIPLHLVDKEGEKSLMRIPLYLKNGELFGNKGDFRINRSYLTPSGVLCLDVPVEILKRRMRIRDDSHQPLNDSVAGFLEPDGITANIHQTDGQFDREAGTTPMEEDDPGGGEGGGLDCGDQDFDSFHDGDPNDDGREANIDVDGPQEEEEEKHDTTKKCEPIPLSKVGLRKRGVKEVVAKAKIIEPLKPYDPHVETPSKRPVRAGRIRKPLPCLCHREHLKEKKKRRRVTVDDALEGSKKPPTLPSIENYISKDLIKFISNKNNCKGKVLDECFLQEGVKEAAERLDLLKKKVKDQMDNGELTEEEINEKVMEATQQRLKETERLANEMNDDYVPDLDLDDVGEEEDLALPIPHGDDAFSNFGNGDGGSSKLLNDSLLYEPSSEYEALVQKLVSEYITSAQEHIASSELTKRVNNWKRYVMPKLEAEEERQTFDIHDYGSHILNYFEDISNDTVPFETIVMGHNAKEVSRYFLSSLMLANTYNIEISQSREGPLEMDCMLLKLLSKVRHHKELQANVPTTSKKKSRHDKRKIRTATEDEEPPDLSDDYEEEDDDEVVVTNRISKSLKRKRIRMVENYDR